MHRSLPSRHGQRSSARSQISLSLVIAVGFLATLYCLYYLIIAVNARKTGYHLASGNARIFVGVASYRDKHCPETLVSMWRGATHPGRIHVGLVDQRKEGERSCVDAARVHAATVGSGLLLWLRDNVRVTALHFADSSGPVMARFRTMQLRAADDVFVMQIDAHSTFRRNWDTMVVDQLLRVEQEVHQNAVLSYHPPTADELLDEVGGGPGASGEGDAAGVGVAPGAVLSAAAVKNLTPWKERRVRLLCDATMEPDYGVPVIFAREHTTMTNAACLASAAGGAVPQPFACGGFWFARSALVDAAPPTNKLRYVFHGEEMIFSARAHAAGWKFFRPCQSILSHVYERVDEPSVWKDVPEPSMAAAREQSYALLHAALRIADKPRSTPPPVTAASEELLNPKDAEAFWSFAQYDPISWTMRPEAWGCPPLA